LKKSKPSIATGPGERVYYPGFIFGRKENELYVKKQEKNPDKDNLMNRTLKFT
jgi:hypothetical protein